ncbi:hypothetical protein [Microtetraspora malaysiensis]|uniref:hypothetical protein n=1 Tax=Microtetraspora malaysiensis TaxID=161358 RepID=UPI003D8D846D
MNPGIWKLDDDPVDDRPTFLAHALAMSLRHGPGPWPEEARTLPDVPPPAAEGDLFVPGAVMDGLRSHHFDIAPDALVVTEIADLLDRLARGVPTRDDLLRLHERASEVSALDIADDLVEQIRLRRLSRKRIRDLGRHLAEHGTRRNAVKIGLVLIGACGDERDRDLLLLLGSLEELTLYAAVALANTQPDRQRAMYELARRVRGWGRIHAVERLRGCDDPEIKAWLLRDGFRNEVMNEYLAHVAATSGDLYSALLEPDVDDALLDGAADILAALAQGGPAEDMSDYGDALPVVARFAELLAGRRPTLQRLRGLLNVRDFVLRESADGGPWPADDIARLRRSYEERLTEPRWSDLVLAHLSDPRDADFHEAAWAAGSLRLPVVPRLVARLEIDPLDGFAWWTAIRQATPVEAELLCDLAARLLPLPDLANGPGDIHDIGEEYAPDRALESVVGGLDAFPGVGLPLIRVALGNRINRLRRAAVTALAAWPAAAVPDEARDWVRRAAAIEPVEETRAEMLAFLVPG